MKITSNSLRLAIAAILLGFTATAQTSYYTRVNDGQWSNTTNVWSTVSHTGAACSCSPGNLAGSSSAYIYNTITATTFTTQGGSSKVTVESGDSLIINYSGTFNISGSATIVVSGTLIFNCNLAMAGSSSITVNAGGTLIVNSTVNNSGSAQIVTNSGATTYIYGNVATTGSAGFSGSGQAFVLGTVTGSNTSMLSVLSPFFSSFATATGKGLVSYSTNPLTFNALQFNGNSTTYLNGNGTFTSLPPGPAGPIGPTGPQGPAGPGISGLTPNYIPIATESNTLANSNISVVGGSNGSQYDTALAGMTFYSDGVIYLGGYDGYGISIQPNGSGVTLYDNAPITLNSINGPLNLQSDASATLQALHSYATIEGDDVIINGLTLRDALTNTDTGGHVYLLGYFPPAGNNDSILSRNPVTGQITEIAKSSLNGTAQWQQQDTNLYYTNGYIGIGGVPQYPLHVFGNTVVTGNIYGNNVYAANSMNVGSFYFSSNGTIDSINSQAPGVALAAKALAINSDSVTFGPANGPQTGSNGGGFPGGPSNAPTGITVNAQNSSILSSSGFLNFGNANLTTYGATSTGTLNISNLSPAPPPSNNPSVASAPGINQLLGANMFGNVYSIPLNDSGNTVLTGNGNFVNIDSLQKNQNLWQQNDTNISYTQGYVGIGTSAPAYPLHVVGNAVIEGIVAAQNLAVSNSIQLGTFRFVNGALVTGTDTITSNAQLQMAAQNISINADSVKMGMTPDAEAKARASSSPIQGITFSGNTGNISASGAMSAASLAINGNSVAMPGIVTDTTTDLMQIDKKGNVTPVSESTLHSMLFSATYPCDPAACGPEPNDQWYPTTGQTNIPNVLSTDQCTWVGVGTTIPDAPLTIVPANNTLTGKYAFTIQGLANPCPNNGGGGNNGTYGTDPPDEFTVDANGNTFMAGNAGIGTQNTTNSALTISNPAITNQIAVTNPSGNLFTVDNKGNTVIGGNLAAINGVPYSWPTSQAQGSVLTNDGKGALTWKPLAGTDPWSTTTFTSSVTGNIWYNGGGTVGIGAQSPDGSELYVQTPTTLTFSPAAISVNPSSINTYGVVVNASFTNNSSMRAFDIHNTNYPLPSGEPFEAFYVTGAGNGFFAGNVGIGTNGPDAVLTLSGGTSPAKAFSIFGTNGYTDVFNIDNSGNTYAAGQVGIGTTAPAAALDVEATKMTDPGITGLIVNTNTPTNSFGIQSIVNNDYTKAYEITDNSNLITNLPSTGVETFFVYGNGTGYFAGPVGIGALPLPEYDYGTSLNVNGLVRANEVRVCLGTCDFVFDNDYKLMPLDTLNAYLKYNHHLPGIASAAQMEAEGTVSIGKMDSQLLQKVEELTLYILQQQKAAKEQDEKIKELEEKLDALTKQVQK
ncbi:MAG: beta strand repeat-containing protein [Bacteroidia bacterium]